MTTKITKIKTHEDGMSIVTLQHGSSTYELEVDATHLSALLVELHSMYEVQPFTINEIETDDASARKLLGILTSIKGVSVTFNTKDSNFVASVRNGDSGHDEYGFGDSAVAAMAQLARDQGFKSVAFDSLRTMESGALLVRTTYLTWIEDFRYGFTRRSDEVLAAEMASLVDPHAGGW